MQTNMLLLTAISLFSGFYFGIKAANRDEKFWSYLLVGLIFTTPLMIGGYTWYDEFYAAGFLLANTRLNVSGYKKNIYLNLTLFFFLYMVFQGFRGVVFFLHIDFIEGIQKFRWIVFYLLIMIIFLRIAPKTRIDVNHSELAYTITKAGLIFTALYTIIGLLAIFTSGSVAYTQFAQIGYSDGSHPFALFGSTAYVATLFIVIIPASLCVVVTGSRVRVRLAWLVVALIFFNQLLYGSRSGILIVLIFTGFYLVQHIARIGYIKTILMFILSIGVVILLQNYLNEQPIEEIFQDLLNTFYIGNLPDYEMKDIDRKVWNLAALLALSDNFFNFIFGWGLRTSGFIVAPFVYELFMDLRGWADFDLDVSTTGFAALAVDGGLLCIAFTFILVLNSAKLIFSLNRKYFLFLSLAPIVMFLQLFVMNVFDVLLFWLSILPGGLFYTLIRKANK